jgi:hypothetical protein
MKLPEKIDRHLTSEFPNYICNNGLLFQKYNREKYLIFTDKIKLFRKKLFYSKANLKNEFIFIPYFKPSPTKDYYIKVRTKENKFKCFIEKNKIFGEFIYLHYRKKVFDLEYKKKFTRENYIISTNNYDLINEDLIYFEDKENISLKQLKEIINFFPNKKLFFSFSQEKLNYRSVIGEEKITSPIYFYNKEGDTEAWLMPCF